MHRPARSRAALWVLATTSAVVGIVFFLGGFVATVLARSAPAHAAGGRRLFPVLALGYAVLSIWLVRRTRLSRVVPRFVADAIALAVVVAVLAGSALSRGDDFASGGVFVQQVGETHVVFAATTAHEEVLSIEVEIFERSARGSPVASARDASPVREHSLRVEGLTPDTEYAYFVSGQDEGSIFRTAPLRGGRPIVFAAIGDTGALSPWTKHLPGWLRTPLDAVFNRDPSDRRQGELAELMASHRPDCVLHMGDVVYSHGEADRYVDAFFEPFGDLIGSVPLYPAIGNHDAVSDAAAPLLAAFRLPDNGNGRYYSFDQGNVHFVCLDSVTSDVDPDGEQARWLDADLAASDARWKVAFCHEPPFASGRRRDAMAVRRAFVPVFVRRGVDLVLSGDDHNYQRFRPVDGVTYVVTGGGGASIHGLRDDPRVAVGAEVYHFVLATAAAEELRVRTISIDGRLIDEFVLR